MTTAQQGSNSYPSYRTRTQIFAAILRIADNSDKQVKRTELMFKAFLSYDQMNAYMKVLVDSELITETLVNGRKVYQTTKKGKDFLKFHSTAEMLLRGVQV